MASDRGGSAAALGARRSRHWGRIVAGMLWAALAGACSVAAVVGVWGLLAGWPHAGALSALVAVGFVVAGTARPIVMLLSMLGTIRIKRDLREQLLAHLDRLPLGWFTGRSAGRVKQAVHDDVDSLHSVYGETYVLVVQALVVAVGGTIVLVIADPLFVLVAAVPAVVAVVVTRRGESRRLALSEASARVIAADAVVNARAVELVQGARVWRVYPGAADGVDRLAAAFDGQERAAAELDAATVCDARVLSVIGHPLTGVLWVALLGAAFVNGGLLAPATLVPFLLLVTALADAVDIVVDSRAQLGTARAVAEEYEAVMAEPVLAAPASTGARTQDPTATGAAAIAPALELSNVTFGYVPGHPVLIDVTLRADAGQTIAVVGASGAGKSTIARLIPRFWDPDAGVVRVLGDDVRDLDAAELYRRVAFVFQDVQLLHRTVADNIRLGDPDAPHERVVAAARAAHVHDRILALPRGYDSVVGEDATLSGGEAQRVSIARALLLDAPIIVLDEATAHADATSEAHIHDAIRVLTSGRTTLVIAHRLTTIRHADRIVVLDGGRVVEEGTFETLTAAPGAPGADGPFRRLWAAHQDGARRGGR